MESYIYNKSYNEKLQSLGIKFVDINTAYISENVTIGKNTIIGPNVIIQDHVDIGESCFLETGCILKNHIKLGNNCKLLAGVNLINHVTLYNEVFIGQYTVIRDEVSIGFQTNIGPWSEVIRSTIGCFGKFGHKNHISDATIADHVYFGLGAGILNSNWKQVYRTVIHTNTKIGGHVCIVAPVTIGESVTVGANVLVKQDIPPNTLVTQEYKTILATKKK